MQKPAAAVEILSSRATPNPLQSRCLALPRTARPLQSTSLYIERDQTIVARKHSAHPEEVALLEALRAGDQRARTTLVRRYHSALVHQAFRVLRDKGLAEEPVQDAWIAAFHSISGFDGGFSIFSWLARIVINKAI